MNCPSCHSALKPLNATAAELDFCPACKGVWFDRDELKKFDNPEEAVPSEINIPAATPDNDYSKGARNCPKCADAIMCRRSFDVQDKVEVDQCLTCSGIWLDGGEVAAVRALYPSEVERTKIEDAWLEARLQETESAIDDTIRDEKWQINANKRKLQYRIFKAVSHLLGSKALD